MAPGGDDHTSFWVLLVGFIPRLFFVPFISLVFRPLGFALGFTLLGRGLRLGGALLLSLRLTGGPLLLRLALFRRWTLCLAGFLFRVGWLGLSLGPWCRCVVALRVRLRLFGRLRPLLLALGAARVPLLVRLRTGWLRLGRLG